jgi:hypothetical protein
MLHNDLQLSARIQSEIRLVLSFRHENIVEVRATGLVGRAGRSTSLGRRRAIPRAPRGWGAVVL